MLAGLRQVYRSEHAAFGTPVAAPLTRRFYWAPLTGGNSFDAAGSNENVSSIWSSSSSTGRISPPTPLSEVLVRFFASEAPAHARTRSAAAPGTASRTLSRDEPRPYQLAFVPAFVEILSQCFYVGLGMIAPVDHRRAPFRTSFRVANRASFRTSFRARFSRAKFPSESGSATDQGTLWRAAKGRVGPGSRCQARFRTVKPARLRRALSASLRSGALTMRSRHG